MISRFRVRHGGLMRCCLVSLDDVMQDDDEPKEGERTLCIYCQGGMVFHSGAWEWDKGEQK